MFSTLRLSKQCNFGEVRRAPKYASPAKASYEIRFTPSRSGASFAPSANPYKLAASSFASSAILKRRFATAANDIKLVIEESEQLGVNTMKLEVPLSKERVQFHLGIDTNVHSFINDIKQEDQSVQEVNLYSAEGARIAKSSMLSDLARSNFKIVIDGKSYNVSPSQVRAATAALGSASAYGVDEFEAREELVGNKLAELKREFIPIFLEKQKHDKRASRMANLAIYGGLGLLVTQWCVLARLTWWDFNWDIMEPVTYFITFGTAVLGYAYYVFTKREYTFTDLRDTIKMKRMAANYFSSNFDIDRYYQLEYKLRRVDPEALHLIQNNAAEYKKLYEQHLQEQKAPTA